MAIYRIDTTTAQPIIVQDDRGLDALARAFSEAGHIMTHKVQSTTHERYDEGPIAILANHVISIRPSRSR